MSTKPYNNHPIFTKATVILFLCLGLSALLPAQSPKAYHVDNMVRINRTCCSSLSKLSVLIPCPTTNQYQTISNVNYAGGTLLTDQTTHNDYVRFLYTTDQLSNFGEIFDLDVSFDAVLRPYTFDFSQVDVIYPYNISSPDYYENVGSSDVYIVPNNPTINTIADELWSNSNDIIEYARHCYEFTAFNFSYLNPYTGLHPLVDILSNGGGDCGNLSSIFISLLRNKSIPSRHVVTIRPDGSLHVWAEFYLENYGWIPVDVNNKQCDPDGDYFGNYDGNGIVVSKGICLTLEKTPGNTYQCVLLQKFDWWYWYNNSNYCSEITAHHVVNSTLLDVDETFSQNIPVFPNPTTGIVNIQCNDASQINVFNAFGQLLFTQSANGQETIDLSSHPSGLYLIEIVGPRNITTKQVIKIQ